MIKQKTKQKPKNTTPGISTDEVHTMTYSSYPSLILKTKVREKNPHSSRPCQQRIRPIRQTNVTQLEIHSKFK